jgi:hypothetical protein
MPPLHCQFERDRAAHDRKLANGSGKKATPCMVKVLGDKNVARVGDVIELHFAQMLKS